MPDIKFDIGKILESKHWISIILAGIVTLAVYRFCSCDWMVAAISGGLALLGYELFLFLKKKIHQYKRKKKLQKEYRDNVDFFAKEALGYFRTMSEERKKLAEELYNFPQKNDCADNERFIDIRDWPMFRTNLLPFRAKSRDLIFIIDNNGEYYARSKSNIIHVVFDPLFYIILDNYIKTGQDCLPNDKLLDGLVEQYKSMSRFC